MNNVFVAGSTGYLARHLMPLLLESGYKVDALVRPGSENKLIHGCSAISGNALDAKSYQDQLVADTFIHLVGVPHPSPSKAPLFRSIDLPAVHESVSAASHARIKHFVYVSVAHPARIMQAYVQTRIEAEQHIRASGLNATFVRPWYVLGPGHRWAYALIPFYKICELVPATRESALRLGLVTLNQMMGALIHAVQNPADGIRAMDVPEIRKCKI